eukprot:GHVO01014946.1.p1 GENE.GHVO01014946.1~~GHVO01014946.1.p1  ORF type:complete len:306 (+),score=41.11 GHVO01014946.1:109-1026(+)
MSPLPSYVCVRVPATSANLGPGFDCMAIALDIWMDIKVTRAENSKKVKVNEGCLLYRGFNEACKMLKAETPDVTFEVSSPLPQCKGLGSSAAAIVGGVLAAAAMVAPKCGPITDHPNFLELFQIACMVEGHPDNVAAAMSGSLSVSYKTENNDWGVEAFPADPRIWCALVIPEMSMKTEASRAVLTDSVSRSDAVFNIARAPLIVKAISGGNEMLLREALRDKMHQDARGKNLPHLSPCIEAAIKNGAYGGCLSGSGPTVLALCDESRATNVVEKMRESANTPAATVVCQISNKCAQILNCHFDY